MAESISRRNFLALTGATAGVAALSTIGIEGWAENNPEIDPEAFKTDELAAEVLVVGSGMAGLFAAVKAHDAGARVIMVSKGRLGSSGQTPFAKGIFSYDNLTSDYTIDEFVEKVGESALGTNNPVYTRQLAEHSQARVNELKSWGFFDSPLYHKSFSKPLEERKIDVIERVTITHLIKEDDKIVGAAGFSIDEPKVYFINAKSVILCTGAGGFKPNGFPINDLTHDGTIMAYRIGAKVTGKEWNDGHPGRSENPAACYDGWGDMFEQKPGITGVGIRHDLGVDLNYQAYMLGNPVRMRGPVDQNSVDLSGGPFHPDLGETIEQGPGGTDGARPGGRGSGPEGPPPDGNGPGKGDTPPPGMNNSSVGGSSAGMAIHKSEGLVPINDKCESNIPGLYAAGDALGSHMVGAIYTQIGSSLAGSAVQGGIAGEAAASYAKGLPFTRISTAKEQEIKNEIFAPLKRKSGYSPAYITQTLQGIMIPNFVLYIKKESMMKAALAYIEELRDHHMPLLRASDLHELRLAHETTNMIISAEMKLKASLLRKESRCSHYRLDYPELDNQNWQAWINIFLDKNGEMKFEKQAFSTWPAQGKELA